MKLAASTVLASLALFLAACSSTGVNTVESSDSGGSGYSWFAPDSDTRRSIFVDSVNQARVEGDILKAQITLRNRSGKEKSFNYLFEWQDASGFVVRNPNSSWKTVRLKPKETISITGIAPKPQAASFTLKLERTL